MNSGDIVALAAGVCIVLGVAVMASHDSLNDVRVPALPILPAPTPVSDGGLNGTLNAGTGSTIPPYRILYTDRPYSYPLYLVPANMETFGASETPTRTVTWVPFAYVEESRGGLTRVFTVPYPVWVLNTTVKGGASPQYGIFRMILCNATTGAVIEGEEILRSGTSYRIVQTSNTPLYLIISTEDIDSFRVTLETPSGYYSGIRPS